MSEMKHEVLVTERPDQNTGASIWGGLPKMVAVRDELEAYVTKTGEAPDRLLCCTDTWAYRLRSTVERERSVHLYELSYQ